MVAGQYGLTLILSGGREQRQRRLLEDRYDATFQETADGEVIGYIPCVRTAPGPRGLREVTVHADNWGDVLDTLMALTDGCELDTG